MSRKKIFILFGALLALVFILMKIDFIDNRKEFKTNVVDLANFVYLHEYGYSEFCSKHGYELEIYPEKMKSKIEDEIVRVQKLIKKANIKDEDWGNDRDEVIQNYAKMSFDFFRKGYIRAYLANEMNIPLDDVIWSDELYDMMPYGDMCEIFDKDVDFIVDSSNDVIENFKSRLEYVENDFEIMSINFSF